MYICIYIYMYMFMCTHIYMYVCIHIRIDVNSGKTPSYPQGQGSLRSQYLAVNPMHARGTVADTDPGLIRMQCLDVRLRHVQWIYCVVDTRNWGIFKLQPPLFPLDPERIPWLIHPTILFAENVSELCTTVVFHILLLL